MPSQSRTPAGREPEPAPPVLAPPAEAEAGNAFAQDLLREHAGGPPADPAAPPADPWGAATAGATTGPVPYLAEMEATFHQDFGSVRAFFGASHGLAGLGAGAAAFGERVAFAEKHPTKKQVAHELTHVVQARGGTVGGAPTGVSSPQDSAEQEASAAAEAVVAGETPQVDQQIGGELHRDGEDAGVPLPAGLPPTPLEEAQRLARLRDPGCVAAFDALEAADKVTFGATEADLEAVCAHADWRAREILASARPPVASWLRIANGHVSDEETLVGVLTDAGAAGVEGTLTHAATIQANGRFVNPNVMRGSVTGAADGPSCVRLLQNGAAFSLLRASFRSESCVEAMPHVLEAPSASVLAAYFGNDLVGQWFTNDSSRLGPAILAWGAAEVATWMRALAWKEHGRTLLIAAIGRDGAGWAGAMAGFLNPPTDADAHWLRGTGPANALGDAAVRVLCTNNLALASTVAGWGQWRLGRFITVALSGGAAPTRPMLDGFLAARPGRDAAFEYECVTDPVVATFCLSLGYPTDIFTLLASDPGRLATTYGTPANLLFANWLDADQAKHGALIDRLANHAAWATAFQGIGRLFRLVWFAGQPGKGAIWKTAVDATGGLYDAIMADAAVNGADANQFRGIAALFGDGTGRTGAQAEATFKKLVPLCVVETPGERSDPYQWSYGNIGTATPPGAAAPVTFRWAARVNLVVEAPQPATWIEMVKMTATQGPAQASAVRRLIFASHANRYWMVQDYQVPGGAITPGTRQWRPFADPAVLVTTSYAMADSGTIIQRTVLHDSAGANAAPGGALGLGRTSAAPQAGDTGGHMDDSGAGVRAGTGRGVGAGHTTDVRDARGRTTNTPLSFFQNHARHEFGHQVGARTYQRQGGGNLELGDSLAQRLAEWTAVGNKATFAGTMFTATNGATLRFTDGNAPLAAADVSDWLATLLSTGQEASGGAGLNVTNASGDGIADKLTAIGRAYGRQRLFTYVNNLANLYSYADIPGMAFEFGGTVPTDGTWVYIWSTRNPMQNQGAKYKKRFFDQNKAKLGWYAFSSASEMFAEMYTRRYTVGSVGVADADAWFNDLEQSPGIVPGSFTPAAYTSGADATMTALLGNGTAAPGAAVPVTEVEPPLSLLPAEFRAI